MDALLLAAVLLTSTLSGVFGMAGGMLLLGFLLLRLPVADAMVLHGVAQGLANGARAALSFRHIRLAIVGSFTLGSALVLAVLGPLGLVVNAPCALIMLGAVPLSEPLWKRAHPPSIEQARGGVAAGALITSFHLFAGTGGPLLDLFFVRSQLDRHGIVATKAAAQTVGHVAKITYFALVLGVATPSTLAVSTWAQLAATAIVGTYVGRRILDRISEQSFRRIARALIVSIALGCVAQGVWTWLR